MPWNRDVSDRGMKWKRVPAFIFFPKMECLTKPGNGPKAFRGRIIEHYLKERGRETHSPTNAPKLTISNVSGFDLSTIVVFIDSTLRFRLLNAPRLPSTHIRAEATRRVWHSSPRVRVFLILRGRKTTCKNATPTTTFSWTADTENLEKGVRYVCRNKQGTHTSISSKLPSVMENPGSDDGVSMSPPLTLVTAISEKPFPAGPRSFKNSTRSFSK